MKLLLTSSGFTNRSIVGALRELLSKPLEEATLAFIPTAANTVDEDKSWLIDDLNNCRKQRFKTFDIVDIAALTAQQWKPRLKKADVLVFGGGNTADLMYWLHESGLATLLPELLKSRVYVGISAGSLVATSSLALSASRPSYDTVGKQPLGLVDFQVRPHLDSPHFPHITRARLAERAKEKIGRFYALDDQSAVKVDGERVEVVSEGVWHAFE